MGGLVGSIHMLGDPDTERTLPPGATPSPKLHVALDAHYETTRTRIAALVFDSIPAREGLKEIVLERGPAAAYRAGEFYRRELPFVLEILETLDLTEFEAIWIDGYVDLGPKRPGLGRILHDALGERDTDQTTPEIIGVAKNKFVGAPCEEVFRGRSIRPLFVTSSHSSAKAAVRLRRMHGPYRLPTILKRVDAMARYGQADP